MPIATRDHVVVKVDDTLYDAKSKTFYVSLSRVTNDLSAPQLINLINDRTGNVRVFNKRTFGLEGYFVYSHTGDGYHGYTMKAFTFDEEMKAAWEKTRS
jgi:hypothetical protein